MPNISKQIKSNFPIFGHNRYICIEQNVPKYGIRSSSLKSAQSCSFRQHFTETIFGCIVYISKLVFAGLICFKNYCMLLQFLPRSHICFQSFQFVIGTFAVFLVFSIFSKKTASTP